MRALSSATLVQLCTAVLVVTAAPAHGQRPQTSQQRDLLQWSGSVDREVQLVVRGTTISVRNVGPSEPRNPESRLVNDLPRTAGFVVVDPISGRGVVDVIQQPAPDNDYTAVISVRDDAPGLSGYRFNVRWQAITPDDAGRGRGGDNGYGDGRDRGRGNRVAPRTALVWAGEVDDDMYIRFRTGNLTYAVLSGGQPRVNTSNLITVPTGETTLRITDFNGRGDVSIVQQPMASNGYMAVIRIRDSQLGYGRYSFSVTW